MLQPVYEKLSVGEQLCVSVEAASKAAQLWVGRGDKIAADQAAVDAFHSTLDNNTSFSCTVVMGEGDKDEAPMLAHGDVLGLNENVHFDLAVDPIDGTTFVAKNMPGAISVAALASPGSFMKWADVHYMKKLAVGPDAQSLVEDGLVRLDRPAIDNMRSVACELGKETTELVVATLDRPRNQEIIDAARQIGAKLILLSGGDVVPALLTSIDDGYIDMLYGSGGAPEAVLAAAGVSLHGGNMQTMWDPQTQAERDRVEEMEKTGVIFEVADLVGNGELHFAMTSITGYEDLNIGSSQRFSKYWQADKTIYISKVSNIRSLRPMPPRKILQA